MNAPQNDRPSMLPAALLVTNLVIGGSIIAMLSAYVYLFYMAESEIPIQKKLLAQEVQKSLQKHQEQIVQEGADLIAETAPPIARAMRKQIQIDFSKYKSVGVNQSQKLVQELGVDLKQEVRDEYRVFLEEHREAFEQAFPDRDVSQLIAEFGNAVDRAIDNYRIEEFAQATSRTANIWNQIEPLEPPNENQPELEIQLADYLLDWAVLRMKDVGASEMGFEVSAVEPTNPQ